MPDSKDHPEVELVWYICACHCGATLFRAKHKRLVAPEHAAGEDGGTDTQQPYVNACNCSICNKNGYLLIYVLRSNMEFIRGWDELRNYRFASKTRDHKFCGECGTSIGIDFLGKHKSGDDIIALNARILQGVDIDKLRTYRGNGRQYQPEYNEANVK